MELMEVITSTENLNRAYKKVVANKGASGVDGITVEELGDYIKENREKIVYSLRNRTYMPKPVRRVYIPKSNGKKRPLGIPTALDRTIQQAIAQPISDIYENIFSEYSYGSRPNRSCHDANYAICCCYLHKHARSEIYYIENSHGIRLENELLVRKGTENEYGQFLHFEVITYVPFDLDAIDATLMRDDEKEQLNAYHKLVYDMVSPYLDEDERKWLEYNTRAI